MPASPTAAPERIKDANVRYHDAAAAEYDAKWGIDFGPIGRRQVRASSRRRSAAGPNARSTDALEIGSGTGYFSLNLRAARRDRAAGRHRHLARHARRTALHGRPARAGRRGRRPPTPRACRSRTELRPGVRPRGPAPPARSRAALRELHRVLGPAGRSPSAASRRATATCSPRCPSAARRSRRRCGAALVGRSARRPEPAPSERRPRAGARGRRPLLPARPAAQRCCGEAGFEEVRIRGEELLANAYGWTVRTLEGDAPSRRRSRMRWRGARVSRLHGAAARGHGRCSSRGCRRRSSTTSCSPPASPRALEAGSAEGERVAGDPGLRAQGRARARRPAAGRPAGRGAGWRWSRRRRGRRVPPASSEIGLPSSSTRIVRGRPGEPSTRNTRRALKSSSRLAARPAVAASPPIVHWPP